MAPAVMLKIVDLPDAAPPPDLLSALLARHGQARRLYRDLSARRKAAEAEARSLRGALLARSEEGQASRAERVGRDAEAMLDGGDPLPLTDLASNLAQAEHLAEVAAEAARRAWAKMDKLRIRVGTEMSRKAAPAHRRAVRRAARAMVELAAAFAEEAALRRDIETNGFRANGSILPAMCWNVPGDPQQMNSPAWTWLRAARKAGFIAAGEDPSRLDIDA